MDPRRSGAEANSFAYYVLATSFGYMGNVTPAVKYFDLAVTSSADDRLARVDAFRGRAELLYSLSRDHDDVRGGRKDFKKALRVLKVRTDGNDTVYEQNAYTWFLRAGCELGLGPGKGPEGKAVKCVKKAWQCRLKIVSHGRGDGLNDYIAGIAAQIGPDKFSDEDERELVKLAQEKRAGPQRPDSSWSGPPAKSSEDGRVRRDVAADGPQADDGQNEERTRRAHPLRDCPRRMTGWRESIGSAAATSVVLSGQTGPFYLFSGPYGPLRAG